MRGNELGDLVAAGAPLYAKFGLRNSRALYPSGAHLVGRGVRDRPGEGAPRGRGARMAATASRPELVQSEPGAPGLGVPQSRHT